MQENFSIEQTFFLKQILYFGDETIIFEAVRFDSVIAKSLKSILFTCVSQCILLYVTWYSKISATIKMTFMVHNVSGLWKTLNNFLTLTFWNAVVFNLSNWHVCHLETWLRTNETFLIVHENNSSIMGI